MAAEQVWRSDGQSRDAAGCPGPDTIPQPNRSRHGAQWRRPLEQRLASPASLALCFCLPNSSEASAICDSRKAQVRMTSASQTTFIGEAHIFGIPTRCVTRRQNRSRKDLSDSARIGSPPSSNTPIAPAIAYGSHRDRECHAHVRITDPRISQAAVATEISVAIVRQIGHPHRIAQTMMQNSQFSGKPDSADGGRSPRICTIRRQTHPLNASAATILSDPGRVRVASS
jgi:hypothetical protein